MGEGGVIFWCFVKNNANIWLYKYFPLSVEINKENDCLEKVKSPSYKLPSKAVGNERKLSSLSHNNTLNTNIKRDGLHEDDSKLYNFLLSNKIQTLMFPKYF